jgi:hypothetical protein
MNIENSLKILTDMLPNVQKAMKGLENAAIMDIAKLDNKEEKDNFTSLINEVKNCKTTEQHAAITEKLIKLQKQYAR